MTYPPSASMSFVALAVRSEPEGARRAIFPPIIPISKGATSAAVTQTPFVTTRSNSWGTDMMSDRASAGEHGKRLGSAPTDRGGPRANSSR